MEFNKYWPIKHMLIPLVFTIIVVLWIVISDTPWRGKKYFMKLIKEWNKDSDYGDTISILPGEIIRFHYFVLNSEKEKFDTSINYRKQKRLNLKYKVWSNSEYGWARRHNYTFLYLWRDEKHDTLDYVVITPEDYNYK